MGGGLHPRSRDPLKPRRSSHAHARCHVTPNQLAARSRLAYVRRAMRPVPVTSDYDGWVGQLAFAERRQRAKRHLMRSGSVALPALRRGLHHPAPIVRRICTGVLDQLVDEESLADLVSALDDDDSAVRGRALHSLACDACKKGSCRPGEELWVPRALAFVRDDPNPDVRAAAIDALGKVADHRPEVAAALLMAAETDRNAGLRTMARRRARIAQRA